MRKHKFYFRKHFVIDDKRLRQGTRYITLVEVNTILNGKNASLITVRYYKSQANLNFIMWHTDDGGVKIGCHRYSLTEVRALRRWFEKQTTLG